SSPPSPSPSPSPLFCTHSAMDAKPSFPCPPSTPPFRKHYHRKRISLTRLSSDTTTTLPVYLRTEDLPDDSPPDYPESANEADADTDHSTSDAPLPLISPRSL
ncbi:hypothetical protein B0F90DRAFT_1684969, partial [Multifurca ochricompacta]